MKCPTRYLFLTLLLVLSSTSHALDMADAEAIPHVDRQARNSFAQYLYAEPHKAYAIAPGGAWAWSADEDSEEAATSTAIERCQANTQQRCVSYAVNNRLTFDRQQWPRLWRPYLDPEAARKTVMGTQRGQRFPNLNFQDRHGQAISLDGRGKVTVLHFWGSWCPPCMREFPLLRDFHRQLQETLAGDAELILLQVREPFSASLGWATQQQYHDMPLYDSGVKGPDDETLRLVGGGNLSDRQIARVFPTTIVLDRNGIVLFTHHGPIDNWNDYLPFLSDAAQHARSGSSGTQTHSPR